MDKDLAAHPEENSGNAHQNTWKTKGKPRADFSEEIGGEDHGGGGTDVDREIEPVEDFGEHVFVAGAELVADMGGDAGFDGA